MFPITIPSTSSRLEFYKRKVTSGVENICDYNAHTKTTSTAIPLAEAPKLDFIKLPGKEIRLRAGEPINIEIRTSGFPFPRIDWKHDGNDLASSDRVGQTTVVLIINISYYAFKKSSLLYRACSFTKIIHDCCGA